MPEYQRLRVTFSQLAAMRYVGHLDLVRTWERALRRAGVPLAYSQGFNPQAKLRFASALPLGATGQRELLDIILTGAMDPRAFVDQVRPQLPSGLVLLDAEEAALKSKALQALLRASDWQVDVHRDLTTSEVVQLITQFLARSQVLQQRTRRDRTITYDLRSLVLALTYETHPEPGWHRLTMRLRSEPAATGRPEQVLEGLGLHEGTFRMHRTALWFHAT